MTDLRLEMSGVAKAFVRHAQGGIVLPVLAGLDLTVRAGECVVLEGPSGAGKSTVLKLAFGSYRADAGRICVHPPDGRAIELRQAEARAVWSLRHRCIGYVSQFLRAIPRVAALDVIAEAILEEPIGESARESGREGGRERARELLTRLRIAPRLWSLPPAMFSGGEQQRVNIARGLIRPRPLLLLDEPTASLDAANAATVIELIREATAGGAAVLGIFHDPAVAEAVATRRVDLTAFGAGS